MTIDAEFVHNMVAMLGNKDQRTKQENLTYEQALKTSQRLCQLWAKKLEEFLFDESKSNSN